MQMLWNEIASVEAMYNSGARYPPPKCHKDTRKKIQTSIFNWAREDNLTTERLCWLSGPAGAGKSAIAQTIAEKTDPEGMLVSSFFFWRGDPQRNNPSRLFLVIAYGLARKFSEFRGLIGHVIKETPDVLRAAIDVQLEKLILEPWSSLTHTESSGLIVIDALDECSTGPIQQEVLRLIASFLSKCHKPLPRILLCSRPEPSIRETLDHKDFCLPVRRLSLDDNSETRRDIERFLRDGFTQIKVSARCKDFDFPTPWPSDQDISSLGWNACGQFIYAQTVLRFVEDEYYNPCKQLKQILGKCCNAEAGSPFEPLDILYRQILSTCPRREQLLDILGAIMYYSRYWNFNCDQSVPFTSTMIEILHGLPRGDVASILRGMHSVIDFIPDGTFHIRHTSFRDFLEDNHRSHKHFVDKDRYCAKSFYHYTLQILANIVKEGFHPSLFHNHAEMDIVEFVTSVTYQLKEQLDTIKSHEHCNLCQQFLAEVGSPFEPLDVLYRQILSTCPKPRHEQLQDILAAIMWGSMELYGYYELPFTSTRIEILYGLSQGDVASILHGMHSVIDFVQDGTFNIHHKSFRDFLKDKYRSHEYFIDENMYCKEFFKKHALQAVANCVKQGLHLSSLNKFAEIDIIDFVMLVTEPFNDVGPLNYKQRDYVIKDISHCAASITAAEYFDFMLKVSTLTYCDRPLRSLCRLFEEIQWINVMDSYFFAQQWNIPWLTLRVRAETSLSPQTIDNFAMLISYWRLDKDEDEEIVPSGALGSLEALQSFKQQLPLMSNLQVVGVIEGYNCPCENRFSPSHLCVDGDYAVSLSSGVRVWLTLLTLLLENGFADYDYELIPNGFKYLKLQEQQSPIHDIDYHMKKASPQLQAFTTGDRNVYSTRALECYMALFNWVDYCDTGELPEWWISELGLAAGTLKSAAHSCGAELEILKVFIQWLDICDIDEMDWCLAWLESFPPVHASKTKEAISKYNVLKKRLEHLHSTEKDWEAGHISESDLRGMLFGELAPDIDSSILQDLNSKV
ncbi:hypothetical protein VNI00_012989 [Paramarasmius palmivorus]|uniref:NACHT domain-containing protein n=1 Tax=Paramarasmius palmivorus TaxID=297713 RepID=A0AAW0C3N7_9AGAR